MKNYSVNKIDTDSPNDENDTMNNTCNDSIVNFVNEDEDLNDPNLDWNDSSECANSKQGRKRSIGSPAEETFSH